MTRATVPTLERISDYVAHYGAHFPDRAAARFNGTQVTYRELDEAVHSFARSMLAAGVSWGDRVATLAPPCPDYLVCFLATTSIGAIWVGLNPAYQLRELLVVLEDCKPCLLLARTRVGDRSFASEIAAISAQINSLCCVVALDEPTEGTLTRDAFLSGGKSINDSHINAARAGALAADPCLIVYTSGTTGKPKGAVISHRALVGTSLEQNRVWPVSDLRILNYFPINHVGCVSDVSCPTLTAGGCIVFLEKYDTETSLRLIEAERVTCLLSVPSVYRMQLDHPDFDSFDLSSVELIIWEGAAMPREMIVRLLGWCDRLASNYSLTESVGAVTVLHPTDDLDVLDGSVGFPNNGVDVRLVNEDGEVVTGPGHGEIQARSDFNMLGYWNNEDATQATLVDGWLRTGDVAVRNPDGCYRIVGRMKEMYKSGGYNVYPREVETAIESLPGVSLAAVIGVPDPLWQEVGIAFVIAEDSVDETAIREWCGKQLANYKIPKQIFVRRDLPLLPIGKVDKGALRREFSAN